MDVVKLISQNKKSQNKKNDAYIGHGIGSNDILYDSFTRLFLRWESDQTSHLKWHAFTILPMAFESLEQFRSSIFAEYKTFVNSLPTIAQMTSRELFKLAIINILITRAHADAVEKNCEHPLSFPCSGKNKFLAMADEILIEHRKVTDIGGKALESMVKIANHFSGVSDLQDAFELLVDPLMIILMSASLTQNKHFTILVEKLVTKIDLNLSSLDLQKLEGMYEDFFKFHSHLLLNAGFFAETNVGNLSYWSYFKKEAKQLYKSYALRKGGLFA